MQQYQLTNNVLTLSVKKASLFARIVLFTLVSIFFLVPLVSIVASIVLGGGFYLISSIVFGLLGFYLLRLALWNTYGQETITFTKDKIEYIADYGWFKDAQKEIKSGAKFGIRQIGYTDDNTSGLVIGLDEPNIICVTKMPNNQLEELIDKLEQLHY